MHRYDDYNVNFEKKYPNVFRAFAQLTHEQKTAFTKAMHDLTINTSNQFDLVTIFNGLEQHQPDYILNAMLILIGEKIPGGNRISTDFYPSYDRKKIINAYCEYTDFSNNKSKYDKLAPPSPSTTNANGHSDPDLLAISAFLNDQKLVKEALDRLDQALTVHMGDLVEPHCSTLKESYLRRTDSSRTRRRLLTSFFEMFSAENGFSNFLNLKKGLDKVEFCQVLSRGSLFKDTVFRGTAHPALGHAIQWWCIVSQYNRSLLPLTKTPAQIYQHIGEADQTGNGNIWLLNFEVTGKLSAASFGNIFLLGQYLKSEEAATRHPVLTQMLRRHDEKNVSKITNKMGI